MFQASRIIDTINQLDLLHLKVVLFYLVCFMILFYFYRCYHPSVHPSMFVVLILIKNNLVFKQFLIVKYFHLLRFKRCLCLLCIFLLINFNVVIILNCKKLSQHCLSWFDFLVVQFQKVLDKLLYLFIKNVVHCISFNVYTLLISSFLLVFHLLMCNLVWKR